MNLPGQRALRKGRCSRPHQAYLVTVASLRRHRHFEDFHAACAVAAVLGSADAWSDTVVFAWVLIPDHWHALIQLGEQTSLAKTMQRINSLSARAANKAMARQGQVWQSSYHDHALRSEEDLCAVARYIVANPLRAGLVDDIGDYPFWNAIWLDGRSDP